MCQVFQIQCYRKFSHDNFFKMMEVVHSTNIVFNSTGRKNGDEPRYRKPPSPTDGRATKVSKSTSKTQQTESTMRMFPNSITDDASLPTSSPLFKPSNKNSDPFGGGPVLETPLSWKKRESPADSGIDLSPISVSPSKINPKVSIIEFSCLCS